MIQLRLPTVILPLLLVLGCGGFAPRLQAGEPSTWNLRDSAAVNRDGVFLDQIMAMPGGVPGMRLRLADAPAFGQTVVWNRAQVMEKLKLVCPTMTAGAWSGAERITIARRSRTLAEAELKDLLTEALQREYVRRQGELQLRLTHAWTPVQVPDEPVEIKILDLPTSGVGANFIVRFDLVSQREIVGTWQAALTAQVWREVWVAPSPLRRGQSLLTVELTKERRDMLTLHDAPWMGVPDGALEIKESVPANGPIYARAVGFRAVVHRGQLAEALLRDGAMSITLKVEVLEEGEPGQTVCVRNPVNRREFRGRVLNEQTIQLLL
jgi:flagella basal body P-ring formation protein FlgA